MHCDFTMGPKPLGSCIWIPTYYDFTRNIQDFSILNGSEFLNKCCESIIRIEMEIQIWPQNKFEPLWISFNKKNTNKNKENESHLGGLSALTEALLVEPVAEFGTKLGKAWAVTIEPVEL